MKLRWYLGMIRDIERLANVEVQEWWLKLPDGSHFLLYSKEIGMTLCQK